MCSMYANTEVPQSKAGVWCNSSGRAYICIYGHVHTHVHVHACIKYIRVCIYT